MDNNKLTIQMTEKVSEAESRTLDSSGMMAMNVPR